VREASRLDILCRFIDANNIHLGLIFCNTKRKVDELTEGLQGRGYAVDALHGDMKQTERDRVMNKFRKGSIEFLVATDVAARGIDVNNIEAVFNYDLPNDEEYYVHRIGRTGRAGKAGAAYSFIFGREIYKLRDIQRYTKSTIKQIKPPTLADLEDSMMQSAKKRVTKVVEEGHYSRYASYIESSLDEVNEDSEENITSMDIASALFQMMFGEINRDYGDAELDAEYARSGQMARLFVNVGSMDKIQPGNLVQGIASKTSLSGKAIGSIDIHKNFTFVEVPVEHADEVVAAMMNFTHRGRQVSFERASKRHRYHPSEKSFSSSRGSSKSKSRYGSKHESSKSRSRHAKRDK
jgi:ATP-dependent RNA helicase DeaD